MNLWSYLIQGLTSVLEGILGQLPIGNANVILGTGAAMLYFGAAPLLILIGSFVNLQLLAISLGTMLTIVIVKAGVAIWRWILKLVPMAN